MTMQNEDKFWSRFTKSQTELEGVVKNKNRSDPGGKYHYADMGDIIETIRDAFNKNGIAFNLVAVPPSVSGHDPATQVAVEAVFSADDGEHRGGPVVTNIPMFNVNRNANGEARAGNQNALASGQAYGFCKRYAAILGAGLPEINPEDAPFQPQNNQNQASSTQSARQPQANAQQPVSGPSNEEMDKFLRAMQDPPPGDGIPSFSQRFGRVFFPDTKERPGTDAIIQAVTDRNIPFTVSNITMYIRDQEKAMAR